MSNLLDHFDTKPESGTPAAELRQERTTRYGFSEVETTNSASFADYGHAKNVPQPSSPLSFGSRSMYPDPDELDLLGAGEHFEPYFQYHTPVHAGDSREEPLNRSSEAIHNYDYLAYGTERTLSGEQRAESNQNASPYALVHSLFLDPPDIETQAHNPVMGSNGSNIWTFSLTDRPRASHSSATSISDIDMIDSVATVRPCSTGTLASRSEVEHISLDNERDLAMQTTHLSELSSSANFQVPNVLPYVSSDTMKWHEPERLVCSARGCSSVFTGKHQRGNYRRHLRLKHGQRESLYTCEATDCKRIFMRKDARLKHYRKCHPHINAGLFIPRKHHKLAESLASGGDLKSRKLDHASHKDRAIIESVEPKSTHCNPNKEPEQGPTKNLEKLQECTDECESGGSPRTHHDEAGIGIGSNSQKPLEADGTVLKTFGLKQDHHNSQLREAVINAESDTDGQSTSSCSTESSAQDDTSHIVNKLAGIHLWDWLTAIQIRTHSSSSRASNSTPVSSDISAGKSTSTGRTSAGSKRSADDPPDDDDSRKKRRKRRPRIMLEQGEVAEGMYACPFPKRDPRGHTRCWDFVFEKSKFPDLKQHLERYHRIPFHCPRCGLEFSGNNKNAERGWHLCQQPQCQEVDLIGRWIGVTADQWELIKKPKRRAMAEHDYWMHIYNILFASQPLSGHPYHEDYKALEARILISTISSAVTNNIMPFLIAQGAFGTPPNNQTSLANNIQDLVEAGVNNGFGIAGIEVDRRPTPLPLRTLSATATAPDLRGLTEDLLFHAASSTLEGVGLPQGMRNSVSNDIPTATNNSPFVVPSDNTTASEPNAQHQEHIPASDGRITPLFDSPPFINWDTSDQSSFGEPSEATPETDD